ncbi:probable serine/threonine-protein kinase PBL28 isoform X2 [Cryptomeria japonica]|nr:probable serine/threonine-protein kinase PBL28 isoform X2 [Cryptomeria japonica]XP_057852420.2 probable serine/threonine-protein kinase PBL28 isoform X2 [Cryptomeria japonica]
MVSYALAARASLAANRSYIFLNSTEESFCREDFYEKYPNIKELNCGMEEFTFNNNACSKLTVENVVDILGNDFLSLKNECNSLTGKKQTHACISCLQKYSFATVKLLAENANQRNFSTTMCGIALQITLISMNINDTEWINAFRNCLMIKTTKDEEQTDKVLYGFSPVSLLAIVGGLLCRGKWKQEEKNIEDYDQCSIESFNSYSFSSKEIYNATDEFNDTNYLGEGTAGKVYKGVLRNKKQIAVKQIVKDNFVETYFREVKNVSKIKHPNLVSLLGYCEDRHEYYLIYELCSQGNLAEWLFGHNKTLSWNQRLNIAVGSARGLLFLHSHPQGCIVHRDIKPTNILLTEDMEAKLSDFGLSRVIAFEKSHVVSEVRGTIGYLDPEYAKKGKLTPSSDVYSFGITLLQLLSGRRVINLDTQRPMTLDKMARMVSRTGNIFDFADKKLKGYYSTDAFELVLKTALQCTSATKLKRVGMKDILSELEEALEISIRTM